MMILKPKISTYVVLLCLCGSIFCSGCSWSQTISATQVVCINIEWQLYRNKNLEFEFSFE